MKTAEAFVEYYTFEDLLKKDGYIVYTNVGCSMLPLLRQKRDILVIQKKEAGIRCKKYDVVLYKRQDRYILHRVLKVLPYGYIIAGDNNTFVETDITDNMILGVMSKVIRNGKTITSESIGYRLYVHIWCDCYPVRIIILKTRMFVNRCFRFVKRRMFG